MHNSFTVKYKHARSLTGFPVGPVAPFNPACAGWPGCPFGPLGPGSPRTPYRVRDNGDVHVSSDTLPGTMLHTTYWSANWSLSAIDSIHTL